MKNYLKILEDAGIELTDEQKEAIKKDFNENYRTKADYDKLKSKSDELQATLDDVEEKLSKTEGINVDELNNKISMLTNELAAEKADRAKQESQREMESTIDAFLNETTEDGKKIREFVNEITGKSIRSQLMEELEKDSSKGKSIEKIFNSLVSDKDGNVIPNIMVDHEKQDLEDRKPRFTGRIKNPEGQKMTKEQISQIKDRTARQAAMKENIDLYQ